MADAAPRQGEDLRVAGYGRTTTEWVPDRLQTAVFSVTSVSGSTVDIASEASPPVATCKGDAGGPALRESGGRVQLVAVNSGSWQRGCLGETQTRSGATETRIDNVRDWIAQHTRELPRTDFNADGRADIAGINAFSDMQLFAGDGGVPATPPARVMLLGDSITGACWRALLWDRLRANGFSNVDFVGTQVAQGCAGSHDAHHEGHGGHLATAIADQNLLPGWLSAARPDVVVMHLGTNDVRDDRPVSRILAAYGKLVEQMRVSNPNTKILVAKIIAMSPPGCGECAQRVAELNNAIPGWASGVSTGRSPVSVVDQHSGFNPSADTSDGIHPNDRGNRKIADAWYAAMEGLLDRGDPVGPRGDRATLRDAGLMWPGGGLWGGFRVISAGDFNGDGLADVAGINAHNDMQLFAGNGAGRLRDAGLMWPGGGLWGGFRAIG